MARRRVQNERGGGGREMDTLESPGTATSLSLWALAMVVAVETGRFGARG